MLFELKGNTAKQHPLTALFRKKIHPNSAADSPNCTYYSRILFNYAAELSASRQHSRKMQVKISLAAISKPWPPSLYLGRHL
jgi:hypothetical protein